MIFIDTSVIMYAVGGEHPLRAPARTLLADAVRDATPLCTSAEVLQELLHAYLGGGRPATLDAALELVERTVATVWPVEPEDVRLARTLAHRHPGLSARDLVHRACCLRREVTRIHTFDRALAAVFGR
ncbi:MAG: type II toxin-antitoxin system VapC family toxin [Gemmatimonadetes bacterium]|nr:type II toxin-antitoxin system VapC family toxin [Gemmatimonadota bacterium]